MLYLLLQPHTSVARGCGSFVRKWLTFHDSRDSAHHAKRRHPFLCDKNLTLALPKVPEQLRAVDVAETEYIASIMALNGYNTEFQPEMEKKLKEFSLLEECRITYIKDVLLQVDQASKGMLACLLGPGGTLEALSLALSRVDALRDASAQLKYVRDCAGMPPLATTREASGVSSVSSRPATGETSEGRITRVVSAPEEKLVAITQDREATGSEVMELSEDGCENIVFAGRDGAHEAVRVLQEMCYCLGEVVSAEENHTRELLRLLQRHGYGSRVSQSRTTGGRSSIAMMEDVVANMSKPSSSACAGIIEGEAQTLAKVGCFFPSFSCSMQGGVKFTRRRRDVSVHCRSLIFVCPLSPCFYPRN